jgi:hypothetical protein
VIAQTALVLAVVAAPMVTKANTERDFFDAIRRVETGGMPDNGRYAVGDNGKSIGPYQIQRAYWQDARMKDGRYGDCLADHVYSERTMRANATHPRLWLRVTGRRWLASTMEGRRVTPRKQPKPTGSRSRRR